MHSHLPKTSASARPPTHEKSFLSLVVLSDRSIFSPHPPVPFLSFEPTLGCFGSRSHDPRRLLRTGSPGPASRPSPISTFPAPSRLRGKVPNRPGQPNPPANTTNIPSRSPFSLFSRHLVFTKAECLPHSTLSIGCIPVIGT
jgi:hypothetical protein